MSYINFIKQIFTGTGSDNTPEGSLIRAGGKHTTNTITLSANNTSANVNVFQLTGSVQVLSMHGEVLDNTTMTNLTGVYFDLWDGTNAVEVTKSAIGATMSGYNVGAFFIKDADNTSVLTTINNDQVRAIEAATGAKERQDWIAIQKTGTNTYIRFNYTTTDAPINAQLKIDISWADIDSGTITAV